MKASGKDFKKLYVSLEFGRLIFGSKLLLLYIALAVCLLIPLATIGIIITYFCGGMLITKHILILLIVLNFIMIIFIILCVLTIIKSKKINNFIKEVLQDSIKITAKAEKLDANSKGYKPYQILVKFNYNGLLKKKISNSGNIFIGYRKYFYDYCGRIFEIMYSPKFDHVLLLK